MAASGAGASPEEAIASASEALRDVMNSYQRPWNPTDGSVMGRPWADHPRHAALRRKQLKRNHFFVTGPERHGVDARAKREHDEFIKKGRWYYKHGGGFDFAKPRTLAEVLTSGEVEPGETTVLISPAARRRRIVRAN